MSTKNLEDRISRLERNNRMLLAGLAGLIFVVVLTAAYGGNGDTVRASSFQLVDAAGSVRAELVLKNGGPGLYLKDQAGVDRLVAAHENEGTGLTIADADGITRIGVVQFAHGGGGVALHGPESKGAAVLYFKKEGSLRFFDMEGNVTRQITASPQASE